MKKPALKDKDGGLGRKQRPGGNNDSDSEEIIFEEIHIPNIDGALDQIEKALQRPVVEQPVARKADRRCGCWGDDWQ